MFTIVITSLSTLLASILAVYLTIFYQRSKPWVGIKGIKYDDRFHIDIPQSIQEKLQKSKMLNQFKSLSVPLKHLIKYQSDIEGVVKQCDDSIDILRKTESAIQFEDLTDEDKRLKILNLLGNSLITAVLEGMNHSGSLPLPTLNVEDIQKENSKIINIKHIEDKKNSKLITLFFNNPYRYQAISTNLGVFSQEYVTRTSTIATILQYFLVPYLKDIIIAIKNEIESQKSFLEEISGDFKLLLKEREVIVTLEMSNRGKTPCHIDSTGYLQIQSGARTFEPLKLTTADYRIYEAGMEDIPKMIQIFEGLAEKQGVVASRLSRNELNLPESIIINPNQIMQIEMSVIQNVDDIPLLEYIEKGLISCRIYLNIIGKKNKSVITSELFFIGKERDNYIKDAIYKKIAKERKNKVFQNIQ